MATAISTVHVPLEVYLDTSYRPDVDWIDGELRERNMCEMPHASVQGFLARHFGNNGKAWGIRIFPEQRVQTSKKHYRIADLCVVLRDNPLEPIVRTPPLLCIEILSREDTMTEMQERLDDYFGMGVQAVWVIDPRRRHAVLALPDGSSQTQTVQLTVPGTEIAIPIAEIFAELDEMEAAGQGAATNRVPHDHRGEAEVIVGSLPFKR